MNDNLPKAPRSSSEGGAEKFIPVSEVIKRTRTSYNTLRYYTKIGLLPYMIRRLPYPGAPATVGHYPESVVETLEKIKSFKKQGLSNVEIKKQLESGAGTTKPEEIQAPSLEAPSPTLNAPPPVPPPSPSPSPSGTLGEETPPTLPTSFLIAPLVNEERKHNDLLAQIMHFLTNMIRGPLPAAEPASAKIFSHLLTLLVVFGTLAILSLGFSDLTHARIKRLFRGFWDQYIERLAPGNFLGLTQIANPIVDVNDVLEYESTAGATGEKETWLTSKLPFNIGKAYATTVRVAEDAIFNTSRFFGTIFFGEGDERFISPLGDASFRDLQAHAIAATSIKTTSITTDSITVNQSGAVKNLNADLLDNQHGRYYLDWGNFTNKPTILSSLNGVTNHEGNIDLVAGANILITPDDGANTITISSIAGSNADTLDGLDSLQFLRSDTNDSFTSGTLTFEVGTTLLLADGSTFTVNSANITLGNAGTDLIVFGGTVNSDVIPTLNATYNLGSAGIRWDIGYFDEIVVNTLSAASSDLAGTISSDFSINTDNPDGEDATLTFIRGTQTPNAVLRWDEANDRYRFESFPVYLDSQLISGVAAGTAPFVVSSNTLVSNLNADLFDTLDSSQFLRSDTSDAFTSGTLTFNAGTALDVAAATLTLADSQVGWVKISKTNSSLADLATRSAGDLSSGNLDIARMPTGGEWELNSDLSVESGTLFVGEIDGGHSEMVGIRTPDPEYSLDVNGNFRASLDSRIVSTDFYEDAIELNTARTGNRYAYIDFHGDDTYTDYGLRLIRGNTGANTASELIARGTGGLYLTTIEAGSIFLKTSNSTRVTIDGSTGVVTAANGGWGFVRCRLHIYRSGDYSIPAGTTFVFNTERIDECDAYNNSTGVWTVPYTGYYNVAWRLTTHDWEHREELQINTGGGYTVVAQHSVERGHGATAGAVSDTTRVWSAPSIYLQSGWQVRVVNQGGNPNVLFHGGEYNTYFSAYLHSQ